MPRPVGQVRLWLIADAGLGTPRLLAALTTLAPAMGAARGHVGVIERDHLGSSDAVRLRRLQDIQALLAPHGVPLLVNSRVDLARAAGASGVQLTARSLPVAAVRAHVPTLAVALSVHEADEAVRAEADGADLLLLAPVHAPLSKPLARPALGEAGLAAIAARTTLPVIALGGMTPDRVAPAIAAGAAGVASLGGVLGADAPLRALETFLSALDRVAPLVGVSNRRGSS
jgi:thiamine-phosphate diphosphorylase